VSCRGRTGAGSADCVRFARYAKAASTSPQTPPRAQPPAPTPPSDEPASTVGSLRWALAGVNASAATSNTITFGVSTVTIVSPAPSFEPGPGRTLIVNGSFGGSRATLSSSGSARLMASAGAGGSTLAVSNLVVSGITFSAAAGGAALQFRSCRLTGAGKSPGKAVLVRGASASLLLEDCDLEDHANVQPGAYVDASGAAVAAYEGPTVTVRRSRFAR
jgi:hypothetical protein